MNILPERIENLDAIIVNDMKACMKKPIPIKATKMYAKFRVQTMEGNYKQGMPGDYLMCGVMGELYICNKDVFEKSYSWVKEGL